MKCMETEKKKAYLRSYQAAERKARRIEERIETLREQKMHPGMTYDDMPHGSGQTDLSDYIVEIENLIEELKKVRLDAINNCRQIEKDIESITAADKEKENNMKLVLAMRYIDKMEWEEIAEKVGYSVQSVYRLHGEALLKLNV